MFDDVLRLRQLDVSSRRVFLRADLDAARSPWGAVLDDLPLRALLPTLRQLVGLRAKVIIGATLGSDDVDARAQQEGVASRLGELLGAKIGVLSKDFAREIRFVEESQIVFAPNLASIAEDAENDRQWASEIARSVDVYVLEGLRAAQCEHASVATLPMYLPSCGVGPLVGTALDIHHDIVEAPAAPFALLLGGTSVRRLEPLVRALLPACTDILLGGAAGNTFLVAQGWRPGASPYEEDGVAVARSLLDSARAANIRVHAPIDAVVRISGTPSAAPRYEVRALDRPFADDEAAVDVAVGTCAAYAGVLAAMTTVLWVGAMGELSTEETHGGSLRVGQAATLAKRTMIAGDDTVAAAAFLGIDGHFRVAPGGDAALALLSGETFVGLEALRR